MIPDAVASRTRSGHLGLWSDAGFFCALFSKVQLEVWMALFLAEQTQDEPPRIDISRLVGVDV